MGHLVITRWLRAVISGRAACPFHLRAQPHDVVAME